MEFQGTLKKEHVEFPGVNKKQKWNFKVCSQKARGSWFLTLEFTRGVTQFCRISRDKVTNEKILGFFFFRKVYPQLLPPPLFGFFLKQVAHQHQAIYPTKFHCCKLGVTSTKFFKLAILCRWHCCFEMQMILQILCKELYSYVTVYLSAYVFQDFGCKNNSVKYLGNAVDLGTHIAKT